jgi:hypothetical protein
MKPTGRVWAFYYVGFSSQLNELIESYSQFSQLNMVRDGEVSCETLTEFQDLNLLQTFTFLTKLVFDWVLHVSMKFRIAHRAFWAKRNVCYSKCKTVIDGGNPVK